MGSKAEQKKFRFGSQTEVFFKCKPFLSQNCSYGLFSMLSMFLRRQESNPLTVGHNASNANYYATTGCLRPSFVETVMALITLKSIMKIQFSFYALDGY